jgi:hypothetical protein
VSVCGGSLESASLLCWCVLQESGFSCFELVFTFHLLYNKLYTFSMISKDYVAINCITVHTKKVHSHEL